MPGLYSVPCSQQKVHLESSPHQDMGGGCGASRLRAHQKGRHTNKHKDAHRHGRRVVSAELIEMVSRFSEF